MLCWMLRISGAGLLGAAVLTLVRDAMMGQGPLELTSVGALWYRVDAGSLNLIQATVQRYADPAVWDMVIMPALLCPAPLAFAVIGGLLLAAGFRRTARRTRGLPLGASA